MSSLVQLGWDDFFEQQIADETRARVRIARVVEEHRGAWRLAGEFEGLADIGGRLRHDAASAAALPAVGDWVCATAEGDGGRAVIRRVLDRRSALSRAAAGALVQQQVIASNVDTLFVVTSFSQDLSANRIDRYLTMAWEAGTVPVVVLNKMDLCEDVDAAVAAVRARLAFVDVQAVTALTADGVAALSPYLLPARTVALVGSSGVGKSSLVNRLLGEQALAVSPIREADGKGRHTTTSRHLVALPGGALLVDTPGMRELQPWSTDSGLAATFEDVIELAGACRFGDCGHTSEPGCAVLAAIGEGRLDAERLESFRRLAGEAAFEARKHDKAASAELKRQWKQRCKAQKQMYEERGRR